MDEKVLALLESGSRKTFWAVLFLLSVSLECSRFLDEQSWYYIFIIQFSLIGLGFIPPLDIYLCSLVLSIFIFNCSQTKLSINEVMS